MHDQVNKQPAFNAPRVILVVVAVLLVVHAGTQWLLGPESARWVLVMFSFVPEFMNAPAEALPSPYLKYWSPLSYAVLHADWVHVGLNSLYLLVFGAPVARRFGSVRFLALLAAGALGGALAHYISHADQLVPMIGASASVSAALGAACRFILTSGSPSKAQIMAPARSLSAALTNRSVLVFVGVWFAINWLFGTGVLAVPGEEAAIAWQAHIGGFVVGFFGFALFDPISRPKAR